MKRIIILKGKGDTGKTTKINTIAKWIIDTYEIPNSIDLIVDNLKRDTWGVLEIGNLTIGINTAGDNKAEILKIDNLLKSFEVDILICACRTKGITYQHLYKNYIKSKGWLDVYINVHKLNKLDLTGQEQRDAQIIDEMKSWLIGLTKVN